jgi:hypothetical protein
MPLFKGGFDSGFPLFLRSLGGSKVPKVTMKYFSNNLLEE